MANDAFETLYREYAPGLFAFLVYRTGDRDLAEDLVADTFERVLKSGRRYDPRRGRRKTWIYAIALNLMRDRGRRAGAEERSLQRAFVPEEDPPADESVEARAEVARLLPVLSDDEREAIALRFGAELTLPEMQRLTGQPMKTLEARLYRALRKLREAGES